LRELSKFPYSSFSIFAGQNDPDLQGTDLLRKGEKKGEYVGLIERGVRGGE